MRLALLVNASASSVSPALCDIVTRALRADHEVEVADTHRRGHAGTLALDAARRGLDVVVVLGGDGTLNEKKREKIIKKREEKTKEKKMLN
jgi:diacylglycerol kinase family enzyme